ncbi:NUDIX hydrolase [Frigoribacterium faeni]|uniref:ADP-ribose pyrophosphatase YjhB (NUDIX family) n=1 Tax=Frigoribacterium faeni TaxID=145483 RepID=A0A7W3JHM7_9MICO|nr:NUDIX domain-containing protein [Frigoribacterium faeni]MBA8812965.1 ADP-ribose pyrophosphatase YjhB (NUDIX family) [Frigoribacterium faeni]BFF14129.1 NUDIX hydrolase [Microbacterium flavescens]GEK82005.1 DNA mismatch repair protein MutT [Frigoribacterium faeni]
MTERVVRATSRLIVVDEEARVLLMMTKAPDTSGAARWITPGGGVDPGEDHAQAAIRELREETGQIIVDAGPVVRVDDFAVPWDAADHTHGHAEFFVVRLPHFDVLDAEWTDDERVDILESRWFTLDELETTADPVEPSDLAALVRRVI